MKFILILKFEYPISDTSLICIINLSNQYAD